jgi:ectoine hydroxylase-related dioxygenase (phytanoyl-CoA dioxygenase family)
LGGLKLLPGSHREGLRRVQAAQGAGGISAVVDEDDPRWVGPADYHPGDVLLFHSLTVHTAPSNQGDRLRLSADFRFQSAADPMVSGALHPHSCGEGVPPWWALTQGWESTQWIDVPHPVRIAPSRIDPDAVPTSRLLEDI